MFRIFNNPGKLLNLGIGGIIVYVLFRAFTSIRNMLGGKGGGMQGVFDWFTSFVNGTPTETAAYGGYKPTNGQDVITQQHQAGADQQAANNSVISPYSARIKELYGQIPKSKKRYSDAVLKAKAREIYGLYNSNFKQSSAIINSIGKFCDTRYDLIALIYHFESYGIAKITWFTIPYFYSFTTLFNNNCPVNDIVYSEVTNKRRSWISKLHSETDLDKYN